MRKFMIACGLLFLAAAVTKAQEARGFEVSGNYQYVRFNPGSGSDGINCQGGSGSAGAYLTSRLGVIGEFGGCKVTGLPSGATAHELDYLFGPRFYFPAHGRVFPYVQALFGGERFTAGLSGLGSSSTNAFAMTAGGGADITLSRRLSFRAIQVEYLYTHFGGESQNNLRLQTGLVYRFGR
ncbi:MAG TPA: porin family protein [Candidatus Acidoferrum sp.]|nr:porin family protein [Candidatus Acidoferrum sp.]